MKTAKIKSKARKPFAQAAKERGLKEITVFVPGGGTGTVYAQKRPKRKPKAKRSLTV